MLYPSHLPYISIYIHTTSSILAFTSHFVDHPIPIHAFHIHLSFYLISHDHSINGLRTGRLPSFIPDSTKLNFFQKPPKSSRILQNHSDSSRINMIPPESTRNLQNHSDSSINIQIPPESIRIIWIPPESTIFLQNNPVPFRINQIPLESSRFIKNHLPRWWQLAKTC